MSKYISANYIAEKMRPIESLIEVVHTSDTNDISDKLPYPAKDIAFAFAVIVKELGVEIPKV